MTNQTPSSTKLKLPKPYKRFLRAESLGGATNAAGALGNGGLTVGISPWSELIYFRWPTLSYYDHLRYFTKSQGLIGAVTAKDTRWGLNAPSKDWIRYGRPFEAYPGLGARGGIYFDSGELSWFGDETWTSSRRYEPAFGPILCTTLSRDTARVEVCQWVDWNSDLFAQEFRINAKTGTKFFFYGTFAPSMKLDKSYGVADSKKRGFAAIYLPKESIILYFIPNVKDKKRLIPQLKIELTAEAIDALYPEGGIFLAMGTHPSSVGFQIGADRKGRSVKKDAPLAASENAESGKLDGNSGFIGPVDAGFEFDITKGELKVRVLLAIANTAVDSVNLITNAQGQNYDKIKQKTIDHWIHLSEKVNIAPEANDSEKRVGRRSITNIFIGQDRKTGAIVAAPTRQPAYLFDWPRDGAFFDVALDLAGFPEIVDHHLEFYRQTQRKNRISVALTWILGLKFPFYCPRGHWDSNLYSDGRTGALSIIPFELDETALLAWDFWRHEQFIPDSQRPEYQQKSLETLQLAANAIHSYVNKRKGWVKRANEDDNIFPGATLHCASSVLTGLAAAIDAGQRWGVVEEEIERWTEAAIALREGILRRIDDKTILKKRGWRGIRWTLFPAPVFENYDDAGAAIIIDELTKEVQERIEGKVPAYNYLSEGVFILALVTAKNPNARPLLTQAVDTVINKLPIPGTDCYGENTILIKMPRSSTLVPQQRVSIPHIWEGSLAYLTVEAYYRPERFLNQIPPIPK